MIVTAPVWSLAPPAADKWLVPDLPTRCPDHTLTLEHSSDIRQPRQNITRCGIHIFVKINLSPERGEESAANTHMP